ncbi:hypothetical protein BBD42_04390 [Paenibacillus sp. BIHB 4019]|uniref:Probable membrane transporter protein n=1 Tax=Paenibacillus sp. BIHB 4019 TaxID=1870819 RepID=A0A1B2DDK0_9BACL|nr:MULTISPECIES: sulfite exporter TauE/SafE family protein [unclassified Paenibacillus]ANY65789.1 hypothetical protein BBD42_04390 [Paenibacillus sp. BIHB 4019]KQO18178.1 hypothetical protein ASF12_05945 [Paenibacillus sp. Leaf72]
MIEQKAVTPLFEWIALVLLGMAAAMFGSIVGLGGGIIIVPALMYLGPSLMGAPIDHGTAVGTSLTMLIVTALASTLSYAKRKIVDYRSAWLLFTTSGPAAMLGAAMTGLLKGAAFNLSFGIFMLLISALLIVRNYLKPVAREWPVQRTMVDSAGEQHTYGYAIWPMLVIGFGVGIISGLFGIGGGSLFVPLMVLLFRFPPHAATATSMFVIFLSSILGSATHVWLGEINWWILLALIPGAWVGGKLGAYVANKMSGNGLLWLLRVTLLVLACQLVYEGIRQL